MPLISTVPSSRRRVAARSWTQRVTPSAPIRRYSTSPSLPSASARVERVVGGAVVRVHGRVPVRHLGVGLRAAEQAVGPGSLEQLLHRPVGERLREVDVLADDVEQTAEALARLGGAGVGLLAPRDVGDDALDAHAAVGPAARPGAIPQHARHAVEPDAAGRSPRRPRRSGAAVVALVRAQSRVDARLPELARRARPSGTGPPRHALRASATSSGPRSWPSGRISPA